MATVITYVYYRSILSPSSGPNRMTSLLGALLCMMPGPTECQVVSLLVTRLLCNVGYIMRRNITIETVGIRFKIPTQSNKNHT